MESRHQLDQRLRAETDEAKAPKRRAKAVTAADRRAAAAAFLAGIDEKVYILRAGHATLHTPIELVTVTAPNPFSPANRARRERHAINRGKLRRW